MSSKKLKQVYTKFAKPRRKFTLSLQNQDKSLHKVWKTVKKFTQSLKSEIQFTQSLKQPEKSLHKVWKTQKKFTQSLNSTEKSLHKVYTKFEKQQKKFTQSLRWANCVNLCKQIAKFTRFCPPMCCMALLSERLFRLNTPNACQKNYKTNVSKMGEVNRNTEAKQACSPANATALSGQIVSRKDCRSLVSRSSWASLWSKPDERKAWCSPKVRDTFFRSVDSDPKDR